MNLSLAAMLLLPAALAAAPAELFVSPDGQDTNPGTAAAPLQTLAAARDKARGMAGDGVVVNVAAGVYSLTEPLAFSDQDRNVTFRGDRANKPQILGGRVLQGFEPYRDGIMKLDLAKAGLKGVGFGQLFFNGQRMTLARTPNADPADIHGGVWAHVVEPSPRPSARAFVYDKREVDPSRWANPADGRIGIFCRYDWRWNRIQLKSVDLELGSIELSRDATYELETGDRYFIEGIFEELDQPGEWYLDRRTDTLYFYPPDNVAIGQVSYSGVDQLITMTGSAKVRFEQFIIEGSAGNAVEIKDATDCAIVGSEIRNTGAWAVAIDGGQRDAVLGCDIHDTGYGGVRVSGGDRQTLTASEHRVDNNYIHHIAIFEKTYNTAINIGGVGNQATHNLIHDTPHAALTLAGNDNLVEFNIVHHTNLQSTDTGGIYSCPRDWTQRGNIIRYNRWSDIGGFGKKSSWTPVSDGKVEFQYPHFTWAIYMDDPTSGNLIYGNVLYRVPVSGLHNHGGRDNVWQNNIIVDCPAFQAGMLAPDWDNWPSIYEKFRAVCQPGSVYFTKYPALADYKDDHPEAMTGLKFERNIVYYTTEGTEWLRHERGWGNDQVLYTYRLRGEDFGTNSFDYNLIGVDPSLKLRIDLTRRPEPSEQLDWAGWQATGMDQHSVLADPKFVDPSKHDYRLKPDSPALKLGFEPIPMEQMGLYESPDRASWPVTEAPGAAAVAKPEVRAFKLPGSSRWRPGRSTPVTAWPTPSAS